MPILIPDSRTSFRTIGGAAAISAILALWLFVRLSPWRLPPRADDEWEILLDIEFPELAERVFRKIQPRPIAIERPEIARDPQAAIQRDQKVAEFVDRGGGDGVRPEQLDERRQDDNSGVIAPSRPTSTGRPADFQMPRPGDGAGSPLALTQGEDPPFAAEQPTPDVERVSRDSDSNQRDQGGVSQPSRDTTSQLLEWMRQHPGRIEPQVETFILSGTGGSDLNSVANLKYRGGHYILYLAAIVDRDEEERSEIRVGVLDRDAEEIAQLVGFGRRAHSNKIGTVRLTGSGEVSWIDARPRFSSEPRWGEVFSHWLESIR